MNTNTILPDLDPNERIVWIGAPVAWRYAGESMPFVKLGGLFLVGGLFWASFASTMSALADSPLRFSFLLPVVTGVGMGLTFPWQYLKARSINYAITNQRAMIVCKDSRECERSFPFEQFPEPCFKSYQDGSGDIIFQVVHQLNENHDSTALERQASVKRLGLLAVHEFDAAIKALSTVLPSAKQA